MVLSWLWLYRILCLSDANVYTLILSRIANDSKVNAGGLADGVGRTERMVNLGIRHAFQSSAGVSLLS